MFVFDFPSFVEDWLSWGEKWFVLLGVYSKLISVSAVTTMTIVGTRGKSLPRHLPAFCVKPPNPITKWEGLQAQCSNPKGSQGWIQQKFNLDYPQGGDGGSRERTITLAWGRSAWRMPFFQRILRDIHEKKIRHWYHGKWASCIGQRKASQSIVYLHAGH